MENILLAVLGILVNLECIPTSEIYPSIYWVPENPLFNGNCSQLILKVKQASTVNFVCPNPSTILETRQTIIQPANMYENMWMVNNKSMYDSCNATNGSSVFECDKPENLHYFSVVFNPHTADGGLSFSPGKTYYFLATSDGTQARIKDRVGGRCKDIYMKFEIYVCNSTDTTCNSEDIGKLKCNDNNQSTTSSLSTPSLSTPSLSTPAPTSTPAHTQSNATEETPSAGQQGAQGERKAVDDDAEMRKWRTLAIFAFAIAAVAFVVVVLAFVIYKFIKKGKPSNICFFDVSSNKIKHQSSEGYNNQALYCEIEDGSDKIPSDVIENEAVVVVTTAPDDKTEAEQDPNGKTSTDNARNMAVDSGSKVPQENPFTFAT